MTVILAHDEFKIGEVKCTFLIPYLVICVN